MQTLTNGDRSEPRQELVEYVKRRGWRLCKEYCDKGVSGTKEHRPALDALLDDCRRCKIDVVVVWKFDRFARSLKQLLHALELFRKLGIGFVSCTEAIDTSLPHGEMLFQIIGAIAQRERSLIVERVRAGLQHARSQGRRLGRPPLRVLKPKDVAALRKERARTKPRFGKLRLTQITPDLIEDFKDERLAQGAGPATINRDLAVLRRMLKLAERRRFIARSPFAEAELLEERSMRRKPHIVTYEEEERILQVADPHIHALVVTQLETGMRPNRETLMMKWEDVDLANDMIWVRESKTRAGIRNIPLSARCKAELLAWRNRLGPEFSPYVLPNMRNPKQPLKDIRRAWAKALKLAGIPYF